MIAVFSRFLLVGAFCTGLMYGILITTVECLRWPPLAGSFTGYVLSSCVNYLLNYYLTFGSEQQHGVAVRRFMLVSASGLLINSLIMYFGTKPMAAHYLPVQLAATIVVLFWNFLCSHHWTFKTSRRRS